MLFIQRGRVEGASAFPAVSRVCAALLCGRTGRLTAGNGGFRPGQYPRIYGLVFDPAVRVSLGHPSHMEYRI
jgi:hypothetical protein